MGAKRQRDEGEPSDDDTRHPPEGASSSAAAAPAAAGNAAPRLQHCFVVGDLVEGMFVDNCWVAGRVVDARVRQIRIEYEKEAVDTSSQQVAGPRHTCERDNETPRDIARKVGVPLATLLALNAEQFPDLVSNSRLKAKTTLALPELHVCSEGETPRAIAKRFGRNLDLLLEMNGASINSLAAGSKLRLSQQLVLPPIGAEPDDSPTSPTAKASPEGATGGFGWLPPQLGETVEILQGRVSMQAAGVSGGRAPPGKGAAGGPSAGGRARGGGSKKGAGGRGGQQAEAAMEEESEAATGGDVGAEAGDGVWLSGEVV